MRSPALAPLVTLNQARGVIQRKAPSLNHIEAELKYHPFAAFAYRLHHSVFKLKRFAHVHTLVDVYTGKAYISDAWPTLIDQEPSMPGMEVADPHWNSVTFEQARLRSEKLVRTANLRRYRLSGQPWLEEIACEEIIWKPNWLLTGTIFGQTVRILVDGLTSRYYVVGS
jgi:hypothetical protein